MLASLQEYADYGKVTISIPVYQVYFHGKAAPIPGMLTWRVKVKLEQLVRHVTNHH